MRKARPLIYGPVPSRRLGLSLGVDLVPSKTCDYDCVYCQLGRTTNLTTRRSPYIPARAVLEELERRLETGIRPDYITMAGTGEPTLNTELASVISGVRKLTEIPVAVITNGSLLGDSDVQAACLEADLVLPSLDAGDEDTFRAVNRPCAGLELAPVVEGLVDFRSKYRGKIWLEIMLLDGLNSSDESVEEIRRLIGRTVPDEVHLNTVRRPPVEPFARRVSPGRLEQIRSVLEPAAMVLDPAPRREPPAAGGDVEDRELLALIERGPCTRRQIADLFGINEIEALKRLSGLMESNLVVSEQSGGEVFYRALPTASGSHYTVDPFEHKGGRSDG